MIRIIGALLPEPTQQNFHPYGLASYGLTYTGYQLFENATRWDNEGRIDPGDDAPIIREVDVACIDCSIEVRAGESGTAELAVHNTGNVEETFHLRADLPDGWGGAVAPPSVTLAGGEKAVVELTVHPPREEKGVHATTVHATTGDGEISDADTVSVEVIKGPPSSRGRPDFVAAGALTDGGPTTAVLALIALLVGITAVRRRRRAR